MTSDDRSTSGGLAAARSTATMLRRLGRSGLSPSPMAVPNTLALQRRTSARPGSVFVNGPTKVRIDRTAAVEVSPGGRLVVGVGGAMGVLDADRARGALVMRPRSRLRVDGRAQLGRGTKVRIGVGATLHLGDRSQVNANCLVLVAGSVTIGAGSSLSWGVTLMDSQLHDISSDRGETPRVAPITIGAHVLIGNGATILPGVTIGDGAIIGASSVVTHDVEPGAVVAGAPARQIASDAQWR